MPSSQCVVALETVAGAKLPGANSISSDDQSWKIAFERCQKIMCGSACVRVHVCVCCIKKMKNQAGHRTMFELHPINFFNQLFGFE